MTNVAIITARAGSKSIINKNIAPIAGRPVIEYVIECSKKAKRIGSVWCSTDGELIANVCRKNDCIVIPRPDELGGDHVNHGDVIKHAVEYVDAKIPDLKNVVLLLGNTVMITPELFDEALGYLDEDPSLDGVLSCWEAADDHPLRALQINADGLLSEYGGPRQVSTERQSYPKAYYYDQGVWAFRKENVQRRDGPNPWWWMGKRVKPILRPWITGRDINGPFDVPFHEWWVQNPQIVNEIMKVKV